MITETVKQFLTNPKHLQTIQFDKGDAHYVVQYDAKTGSFGYVMSQGEQSRIGNICLSTLQGLLGVEEVYL